MQARSAEAAQDSLKQSIVAQRTALSAMLQGPLADIATSCAENWSDRTALDELLVAGFANVPYCGSIYVVDTQGVQVSGSVTAKGLIAHDRGRDRSDRPYMREVVPNEGFLLSDAYISIRIKRPALSAIHILRGPDGKVPGFLGADFDLRDLPLTRGLYAEPRQWRQLQGDPSIRGNVFMQTRTESGLDRNADTILGVIEELMVDHGVFHVMLHFSSSRAVLWLIDDPFRYRLLGLDELIDADICLAYPKHRYPDDALIKPGQIRPILEGLQRLRFEDETLYLRTGTLNIFNGVVGLTFSCDGSHYIPHDDFLDDDHVLWIHDPATAVTT